MNENVGPVINFYKNEIPNNSVNPVFYNPYQDFVKMAALFSPGDFYCYILNFSNLQMEFVDGDTQAILGIEPEEFTTDGILGMLLPEELAAFEKKEAVVIDFFLNFLNSDAIPSYKVLYYFRLKNRAGIIKTIMHQVITLAVSDSGITHVLGIHTDISHMNIPMNHKVSFLSLGGGISYMNCDTGKGRFDPATTTPMDKTVSDLLTKREIEIIQLFSHGFNAHEIAGKLFISPDTVRIHRQNMLAKMGCTKTSEMVKRCVTNGIV